MLPLMLHSLASVAALHPTAPYQQSINVNTTCDFRAILHPFLTWQPVRGFSGYSGNFRASRAKSALFAAGCANVTHATDAGAPRCSAPIHLCKPGAREWLLRHHSPFRGWSCIWAAAKRLARSALRRQYSAYLRYLTVFWPAENLGAHRGLRCSGSVWGGTPLAYSMWKCANK